jgi:ubiquinone/menaquinone biosynthesis C-methylase UbiE
MSQDSIGHFYDSLAANYHLIYPDWAQSVMHQGVALDALATEELGPGPFDILDCTCGIGTQALGLAGRGHRVAGMDISEESVARAKREATDRALSLAVVVGDMKALPVQPSRFDIVVSGDNAIAHMLTRRDLLTALTEMRRVLRVEGLLVITLQTHDDSRAPRHEYTEPQVIATPAGPIVSFQRWRWHQDGERYDFENIQVLPDGEDWRLAVRRTTLWALNREQLSDVARRAGFTEIMWHEPDETGFFQPIFTARPA